MPNYTVTVITQNYEFWDVDAEDETEAKEKYWEIGTLLDTDIIDAEVSEVELM